MNWRIINQIVSGQKRLVIQKREDSERFCFIVERYFGAAKEDEGAWPDGFWALEMQSGYFGSANEAKAAAWWEPACRNAQISN